MPTILLLTGTVLSAGFMAGMSALGEAAHASVILVALGLVVLPLLTARMMARRDGGEAEPAGPALLEEYEATQPPLLGRGERPFAFESLSEARRAARRLQAGTGVLYCDGFHFLTGGRVSDRDLARAYIRGVYALVPGQPGRPVIHVVGRAPAEPRRVWGPRATPLACRFVAVRGSAAQVLDHGVGPAAQGW
ncbi:hypothetical protein [Pararhodospirillum oryzae]|uniref:Uncharacterized protein n=1 Tax=Pararhodospirillum oryzae TaxID=478448 RepID=A0A512H3D2_9PROT|nr:hypothetical protein [Pararhodospirillum oryzae]GEO79965.1 hypothetical protein ROR02_00960 [Pararhodospirillum oryzae]